MNKKGYSMGFSWIVALISIFVLGLLYIIFNQVMTTEVLPISQTLLNQSPYLNATELTDAYSFQDKGMAYWSLVKYVVIFIILLYLIFAALTGGDTQENI